MAGSGPDVLLVALGAVPGACLRLILVNRWSPLVPRRYWGTIAVNVLACFALGLLLALFDPCAAASTATPLFLLIGTGFFGSLSTFSTFVMEILQELQARRFRVAALLAVVSLISGLLATTSGYGFALLSHV